MNIVLLVSFVVALSPNIEGRSYGEALLWRLNIDVELIKDFITTLEQRRCNDGRNFRRSFSQNNDYTMNRGDDSEKSLATREKGMQGATIGGNYNQPEWEANFYKALSRALRQQHPDNKFIQENIRDGFAPPIILDKHNP